MSSMQPTSTVSTRVHRQKGYDYFLTYSMSGMETGSNGVLVTNEQPHANEYPKDTALVTGLAAYKIHNNPKQELVVSDSQYTFCSSWGKE